MLLVHETMEVIRTTVDESSVGYITLFSGHCRLGEARNKSDNILNYTMIYSGEALELSFNSNEFGRDVCVAKMSLTLNEPSWNVFGSNLHTTSNTCTSS